MTTERLEVERDNRGRIAAVTKPTTPTPVVNVEAPNVNVEPPVTHVTINMDAALAQARSDSYVVGAHTGANAGYQAGYRAGLTAGANATTQNIAQDFHTAGYWLGYRAGAEDLTPIMFEQGRHFERDYPDDGPVEMHTQMNFPGDPGWRPRPDPDNKPATAAVERRDASAR
jgi:hypothetical protein